MVKFFNRELSWLSFNERVLQEAGDNTVPLFERIKFLSIFSSNLEEFYRVRVASLRSLLNLKKKSFSKLDFDPSGLLEQIHTKVQGQQEKFGSIFRNEIIPELAAHKIYIKKLRELEANQKSFIKEYFIENVQPHINPVIQSKKEN